MNKIKNTFSIYDLENLTGIKAHTIRIWEKRYKILNPTRLNRNVRIYQLSDLQKLLNISLLYHENYKISKLAKFTEEALNEEVKSVSLQSISNQSQINTLLLSMYTFDVYLFEETYRQQLKTTTFSDIFIHTYVPLLRHIGILWQTDSLKPVNEHFISNLIYQKILLQIAQLENTPSKDNETYVLFLPEEEIHQIGLLFYYYHLKKSGKNAIYLGSGIPMDNLETLSETFENIQWVTANIIDMPNDDKIQILEKYEQLLANTDNKMAVIGSIWNEIAANNTNSKLNFYQDFQTLLADL